MIVVSANQEQTFTMANVGTPANRWSGLNRGGWFNADLRSAV
jgi:hypothetical protein